MLALWKALILNSLSWLVSQILGNPLDHSSFAVLSWLVVRIHWAGFGVLADDLTHYSVWMMLPVISARKYA